MSVPGSGAFVARPPRLELDGVVVRLAGRTVLRVDRLEVAAGEVLAVLGPNGAGKTTLLHLCGFLLAPTAGRVLLDGESVSGAPLWARRRATLLLQSPMLFDRTVRANVELGLRLRGLPASQRQERSMDWLSRFGIANLASRRARRLSGGEAQRVALARALAFEPEIVLLDEPFTGLDQPTRELLVGETIVELRRLGGTTIFVTHDREEAITFADRVLVLVDGEVRQIGSPACVQAHPVDRTVAAFIGGSV